LQSFRKNEEKAGSITRSVENLQGKNVRLATHLERQINEFTLGQRMLQIKNRQDTCHLNPCSH